MAAKKKQASKSKEVAARKSTAVATTDWQKKMEERANAQSARIEAAGGNYISIKNNEFTYQGADLGDDLHVIVLGFVYYNEYFDIPYDSDNPSSPACYSIADIVADLEPAEDSPNKQCDTCKDCELNVFGSADNGKGKACGNKRRIAVIAESDLDNDIGDIEIAIIKVPVTSGKAFDKYAKGINKTMRLPIDGVITSITFDEDEEWETLVFKSLAAVENEEHLEKIEAKLEEAQEMLNAGHDPSGYRGGDDAPVRNNKRGSKRGGLKDNKKPAGAKTTAKKPEKRAGGSKFSK